MLIEIKKLTEADERRLMDIYAESNRENIGYFFPDCTDAVEGMRKVEAGFLDFLKSDFLCDGRNSCYVLERGGVWQSALRLTRRSGDYYLEALETRPDARRRGYGLSLMREVIEKLSGSGDEVVIRDEVSKKNAASLATHFACGFTVEHENAIDADNGEVNEKCFDLIYRSAAR